MNGLKKYVVQRSVRCDEKLHGPGEEILLDEAEGNRLVAEGVLVPAVATEAGNGEEQTQ